MSNFLIKKNNNNVFTGLFIAFTIIGLIALGPYFNIHYIFTLVLIPCLFLLSIFYDVDSFNKNNKEYIWFLLIFIGALASIFYYQYYDPYIKDLKSLLGAILGAYIALAFNKKRDYSFYFHIGYILSAYLLIFIMYTNGNFSLSGFASEVDYRDRFMLNANAYSYFSFFANFSLFFLHQRFRNVFLTALLLLTPIIFIIIAFVTQSRGGMILIILVNVVYWLFINVPKQAPPLKKLLRKIIVIIALIGFSIQFINIYQGSRIKNRVEGGVRGGDSRGLLIVNSIELFYMNPVLGVGAGQVPKLNKIGQFSHNSYVEILAEQGIIGGIMLLMLFGIPLNKCIKLIKKNPKDSHIRILLLFLIAFYFYNNLYVFYKFPFSMIYFFLIISMINKQYERVNLLEHQ